MSSYLAVSFYRCRTFPEIHAFQNGIFPVSLLDAQHGFLQLVFLFQKDFFLLLPLFLRLYIVE